MNFSKTQKLAVSSSLSAFLAACGSPNYSPSEMHFSVEEVESEAPIDPGGIPELVRATPTQPLEIAGEDVNDETFDVVANNIPLRDLLFAMARDYSINMDVDPDVGGLVTMSAYDQTLDTILARLADQFPIRIERAGDAISVKVDKPYYKRYHVDYTSVARTFSSSSSTGGVSGGASSVSNTGSNSFWESLEESIAAILEVSITSPGGGAGAIASLQSSDSALAALVGDGGGGAASLEAANAAAPIVSTDNSYNFNRDTGILIVYAPDRLQKQVQAYLDEATAIARRQVLLEATVVEVILSNEYRQGIDWSAFNRLAREGISAYQGGIGGAAAVLNQVFETRTIQNRFVVNAENEAEAIGAARGAIANANQAIANAGGKVISSEASYEPVEGQDGQFFVTHVLNVEDVNTEATEARAGGLVPTNPIVPGAAFTAAYRSGDVSAAVELLDAFGDAKVLSSPRISVLHNQPALLRVVDQEVYFNIETTENISETTGQATSRTFNVTENTVDVGFSMNVLPHISAGEEVFLNLKPSVTRVLDYRRAPTPTGFGAANTATDNLVPITRVRELESVMSLRDGEVAVMGGLLEDRIGDNSTAVPGLSSLPGVGGLFQQKQEQTFKTEFVVFIKASIVTNPSIHADYSEYKDLLPDSDFIIRDRTDNALPPKQKKAR